MISGIYIIKCNKNDKGYLGSSINVDRRFIQHKSNLERNKHHSLHLQNAWNKYGKESFYLELIEEVLKEDLIVVEQMYLDILDFKYTFNISKIAGGGDTISCHPLNKEIREKQSKLVSERMSKMSTQERLDKFSKPGAKNGMYNKMHTKETRKLMSKNQRNIVGTNNPFYDKKHTKETKEHLSKLASKRTGIKNGFFGKNTMKKQEKNFLR